MPSPVAVSVHVEAPGSWSPRAAAAWHLAHLWRQVRRVDAGGDDAPLTHPAPRRVVCAANAREDAALLAPPSAVWFAPRRHAVVLALDASMYARTARVGAVPLSAAPKALGAILGALAAPEAAAPLAGVDVELQIVVAFDDSDEFEAEDFQSSDVVWRAAGRCVVRSGEDTANAEKTVADAVRAAESRLARRAFAQFGRARCDRRGGPPQAPRSSLERCAAAGLFALRFASDNRARSVVVATDGNGVGAPAVCGLLGAAGVVADCRRSGCRLHVLDYGGGLSAGAGEANRNSREPSPDGVDDPVVQALGAGDDDDDDAPPELVFAHGGHKAAVSEFSLSEEDRWLCASVSEDNFLQVWCVGEHIFEDEDEGAPQPPKPPTPQPSPAKRNAPASPGKSLVESVCSAMPVPSPAKKVKVIGGDDAKEDA